MADWDLEAILAESSSDDDVGGLSLEEILREDEQVDDDFFDDPRELDLDGVNAYSARDWALLQQILREDEGIDDAELRDSEIPIDDIPEPVAEEPVVQKRPPSIDSEPPPPPPPEPEEVEEPRRPSTEEVVPPKIEEPPVEEEQGPKLWRGARLAAAQAREDRLLKLEGTAATTSPLRLKRRARARETLSVRQPTTQQQPPVSKRGAVSGRYAGKLEGLPSISKQLAKNAQYRDHGPGLPACLSVGRKFVAVGTSRGLTLVFDHFEEVRRVLGTAADGDGVTAVDVRDSVVACGHASGVVALWDVVKGSGLTKRPIVVDDDAEDDDDDKKRKKKRAAICAVRFYETSPGVQQKVQGTVAGVTTAVTGVATGDASPRYGVVAVDARGVVTKIVFAKPKLWAALYGADLECLLDETAKVVPKSLSTYGSRVAFSSDEASFVVALEPAVKIAHKWPLEKKIKGDVVVAFSTEGGPVADKTLFTNTKGTLARAGPGGIVDFLPGAGLEYATTLTQPDPLTLPKCEVVCGIEWVKPADDDDKNKAIVVVLCGDGTARLVDATEGVQVVCIDLKTTVSAYSASDGAVCLLFPRELLKVKMQTAAFRVDALIEAGEWLEALALALDDPALAQASKLDLLQRYVGLAVDNAPTSSNGTATKVDLAKSHFQMLAGVCVEFCVELDRHDVLFGEIFAAFESLERSAVFLDVLEPYVLSKQLRTLAPEIMAKFVNHFQSRGALVAVERSLLNLDVTALDFNMITDLLKTHRLYTALFRVYSVGLDDFLTPLEVLLDDVRTRRSLRKGEDDEDVGILLEKALLYTRYCLDGWTFPTGTPMDDEDRVRRLRVDLMLFLLQRRVATAPDGTTPDEDYAHLRLLAESSGLGVLDMLTVALRDWDVVYPLDDDAEIDPNPFERRRASTIITKTQRQPPPAKAYLVAASEVFFKARVTSMGVWKLPDDEKHSFVDFVAGFAVRKVFFSVPADVTRGILEHLVRSPSSDPDCALPGVLEALDAAPFVPALLDVASARPRACLEIQRFQAEALALRQTSFISEDADVADDDRVAARAFAATLTPAFPENDAFAFGARLFDRLLEQRGSVPDPFAEAWLQALPDLAKREAVKAADVVLRLLSVDQRDHSGVHETIERAVVGLGGDRRTQFRFLDALVQSTSSDDDEKPSTTTTEHNDDLHHYVHQQQRRTFSVTLEQLYVELLAENAPTKMYAYLTSHEGAYDVDRCLELSKDHHIADATAYLLEQTGDSVGALRLMLGTLREKFEDLRLALRAANRDGRFSFGTEHLTEKFGLFDEETPRGTPKSQRKRAQETSSLFAALESDEEKAAWTRGEETPTRAQLLRRQSSVSAEHTPLHHKTTPQMSVSKLRAGRAAMDSLPEGREANATLDAAVRLCRRHSAGGAQRDEAWFATLDQLLDAKRSLQLSRELPSNATLLHAMLDDMVRRALGAMAEYVQMPEIVTKILNDHSDSNLGDFRDVLVGTLQSTKHEVKIYDNLALLLRAEALDQRRILARKMDAGRIVDSVNGIKLGTPEAFAMFQAAPRGARVVVAASSDKKDSFVATLQPPLPDDAEDDEPEDPRAKFFARRSILDAMTSEPPVPQTTAEFANWGPYFGLHHALHIDVPVPKPPVDPGAISIRVPGMLEHRPKFFGALPASQADPAE